MLNVILLLALALPSAERPNVVLILADDLGYGDLGCYGVPDIKTPNIDRLASQGVRFTDFHANGPVCTPSRCGLMTGRYQQRVGGLEWAIYPGIHRLGLPKAEPTIANYLKQAGYATAMSGKWHLGYTDDTAPNAHGFDHFFGFRSGNHDYISHRESNGDPDLYLEEKAVTISGYSTDLITEYALMWLDEIKGGPFFLYVAYNAPHFPFQAPGSRVAKPLREFNVGTRETYAKMVEGLDAGVGELLDRLESLGLAKSTLVVFLSDNGGDHLARNAPATRRKGSLFEGGIRVPCIARWPGVLPAGKVTDQVAITMDWSATFLGLAGAKSRDDRPLDGIDLMPILKGTGPDVPRRLFWRRVDARGVKTHRAARDGQWKYIDTTDGTTFLYDLSADIAESNNLAEQNPELVQRLRGEVDAWEASVDPPLYSQSAKQVK
jgi:arylsulfatase A-like enzyme